MKKFAFAFTLVCTCIITALTSCQPEVPPYTPSTDSTGGLLSYVDGRKGSDTFYVGYQYDAQNKWIGNKVYVIVGGDTSKLTIYLTRDASGNLAKAVYIDSSDLSDITLETETFNLNSPTGRYNYKVWTNTSSGSTSTDTTFYVYNAQGKISYSYDGYSFSSTSDTIPFKYNGSNLDSIGRYGSFLTNDPSGGTTLNQSSSIALKYDNKVAPSKAGDDAILIDIPYLYGANNVTMYTHFEGSSIDHQGLINYVFNSSNKPSKAVLTLMPSNVQYTFNYHYQ